MTSDDECRPALEAIFPTDLAGLSLERVRGRGYRLVAAPDFLDAAAVRAALVEYGVTLAANGLSPLKVQSADETNNRAIAIVTDQVLLTTPLLPDGWSTIAEPRRVVRRTLREPCAGRA